MKSILETIELQNQPFLTHLEAMDVYFYEILHFLNPEIHQIKKKKKDTKMANTAILEHLNHLKLISRKI